MIKINTSGVERLARDVTKLAASVRDVTPILKLLGLLGVRAVQRNFDNERSPQGTPWAPLKYTRRRGSRGAAHILVDTAAMRNGINFDLPGPSTVRIGASTLTRSRNAIHNFGGQTGRRHATTIPRREYMGFSDEERQRILDNVRVQVLRLIRTGH